MPADEPSGNQDAESQQSKASGDQMLEARLAELETQNKAYQEQIQSLDATARRHQARADRLAATQAAARATPTSRVPLSPTDRMAQVEAEAQAARLENYRLQVMNQLGLTDEDVPPDLEFASTGEILNHLQLVSVQKQLGQSKSLTADEVEKLVEGILTKQAQQHLSGAGEGGESLPSPTAAGVGGLIDTGGPSGTVANAKRQKLNRMREEAGKLRTNDPNQRMQGGYLVLRAAHADPDKVLNPQPTATDNLEDIKV